jgi:hypothetical protein
MLEPIAKAARLHLELHNLGWKSSVALRALDQLGAAVIIADSDGRVIQTNLAAERTHARLRKPTATGITREATLTVSINYVM